MDKKSKGLVVLILLACVLCGLAGYRIGVTSNMIRCRDMCYEACDCPDEIMPYEDYTKDLINLSYKNIGE